LLENSAGWKEDRSWRRYKAEMPKKIAGKIPLNLSKARQWLLNFDFLLLASDQQNHNENSPKLFSFADV
jgi:hypothetical protein